MFRKTLTTLALALGLAAGSHTIVEPTADAKPFEVLSKSREGGKRTHKRAKSSSSSKKSDSKKKSSRSSSSRSSGERRVVSSRTTRSSEPVRKNVRSRRTVSRTTSRPSGSSTSTRTVKNVRPRTTSSRTRTTTTRSTRTTHRRGSTVRRTTYRRGHGHHHSTSRSTPSNHRSSSSSEVRGGGKSTVEAYLTGGLGVSGFASKQIVDGALPGAGYNLALGAKGGIFGAELGINGGGYTFEPGSGSTDIGIVGLSGDLKLQPSFGFFEPYVKAGLGGYALADGIVEETATGVGLRLGAGADFRFRKWAFRLSYDHGSYGLQDTNGGLGGDVGARTESLGAALVFYF